MDIKIIDELIKQYKNYKSSWDAIVEYMTSNGLMAKSKIGIVPDDVWSWAKHCVSQSDEILIKWFNSNIPALYGEKPVDILELANGIDVLRVLMLSLPN